MEETVNFYLDLDGVREVIYKGDKIKEVEKQTMERALSEVKAQFLQDFGFEGSFRLEFQYQKVGGKTASYVGGAVRPVYKISASDARTGAILKARPGWLAQFSKGAKL